MKQIFIFFALCCLIFQNLGADSVDSQKQPDSENQVNSQNQEYDYQHCISYYQQASIKVGSTRAVALKHKGKVHLVLYSKARPNAQILRSDSKSGLYLINAKAPKLAYDLLEIDERTLNDKNLVAITESKTPPKGHIVARQTGYLTHAKFSNKLASNSVIGNICYQIYGIGAGGDGFLEKKFIDRFLNAPLDANNEVIYSDIGIRLGSKNIVDLIDPFFDNNAFEKGDEIISVNGVKTPDLASAQWAITNLEIGKTHSVEVKRAGQIATLQVRAQILCGGFLLVDTFLEKFGITLDENLQLIPYKVSMPKPFESSRLGLLKIGDRILWINKKPASLSTIKQAWTGTFDKEQLQRFDGKIQLLIRRGEAEFFVRI